MTDPMLNAHDIIKAKTGIDYSPDIPLWYGVSADDCAIARAQVLAIADWLEKRADEEIRNESNSSPHCAVERQQVLLTVAASLRKSGQNKDTHA